VSLIDRNTFENLKQMSGADFIGELIDTFLEDGPKLIADMKNAHMSQDADSFRRAAHSLKSNAATFGAEKLSGLAKELEDLARAGNLDIGDRLSTLEAAYREAAAALKELRP
jgi:HPt (histidine-containing phosphotransfer) domain-containing protein